jgi:hypothetical protein
MPASTARKTGREWLLDMKREGGNFWLLGFMSEASMKPTESSSIGWTFYKSMTFALWLWGNLG